MAAEWQRGWNNQPGAATSAPFHAHYKGAGSNCPPQPVRLAWLSQALAWLLALCCVRVCVCDMCMSHYGALIAGLCLMVAVAGATRTWLCAADDRRACRCSCQPTLWGPQLQQARRRWALNFARMHR